ncbi:hypothetical protein [Arthrobacter sp. H14-L1]|uniref:hypothetical protein n=1 Tax=Arthrobacter sp. H14-L1 TaxID=2996697 RepID=UPI00226D883E|nr:hypothetical protein [Arthrobacter sp. H14-L1]MCY0904878.1 hypothetical protein [Arthrobacter sp. H14-L1]
MYSLGNDNRANRPRPGKWTGLGTVVLALVFLVALVFAANQNDVLGWFIAAVALGWLILSTFVYIGVHKAASFGAEQVRRAQSTLAGTGRGSATAAGNRARGTTLIDDGSAGIRDRKLEHSFKIIAVQSGLLEEQLRHGSEADTAAMARALETIAITAHNGQGMLRADGGVDGSVPGRGKDVSDDGGTVSGVVVD